MARFMRDFLQFQQGPTQQPQDPLARLRSQSYAQIRPPQGGPPKPPPMPQRPQRTLWDLLPQAFAGAGDALMAGAGQRSDYMGRVMGLQEGVRNQSFQDQLAQAAQMYDAQRMQYEDDWRRAGFEQQAQDSGIKRSYDLAQLEMYQQMMGKTQQEEQRNRQFQRDMYGLQANEQFKDIDTEEGLADTLRNLRLKVKSPDELDALLAAAESQKGIIQKALADKAAYDARIEQQMRAIEGQRGPVRPHSGMWGEYFNRVGEARQRAR